LKSICQPQPQKGRRQQTNEKRSLESETIKLTESIKYFKGIRHRQQTTTHQKQPTPQDQRPRARRSHSTPVDRVNASFGIDFRHAVEFSRIGRTPQLDLSARLPGQPALLYRNRSTESRPDFLTFHPHPSYRPGSDDTVRLS